MVGIFLDALSTLRVKRQITSDISQDEFCGSLVSLDCGDQGYIQGRVIDVDSSEKSITIERPFKDGLQMNEKVLKVYNHQFSDIKVMRMPDDGQTKILPIDPSEVKASPLDSHGYQSPKLDANRSQYSESDESPTYAKRRPVAASRIPLHSVPASVINDRTVEKIHKVEVAPPQVKSQPIEGIRINVNDLLAARPSSSGNSVEDSGQISPTGSNIQRYKEYGQFKHFESQQVPEPCRLRVSKNRRGQGPCGIPALDCSNGYGHFSTNKNPELSKPLDFNLLNTDFDFDASNNLFNKDSITDDENESSSPELREAASRDSRNFRHDENILDDPSRVISWLSNSQQQQAATMFKPLRMEATNEDYLIPVLSAQDKQRYIKEAEEFLGTDVLYAIVADRLLLYILNIMDRYELLVKTVVLVGSDSTPEKLTSRILQHLSNRSCSTVVYGVRPTSRNALPCIRFVESVNKLPFEIQFVIVLDSLNVTNSLQMWFKRVGNGPQAAHIVALDDKLPDVAHSHTLYVGTLVEPSYTSNNDKNSMFRESAVTEVGCPFDWFEEDGCQALIEAFGSQVFVNF